MKSYLLISFLFCYFSGYSYTYNYTGTFVHQVTGEGGTVQFGFDIISDSTIAGYIDFTNYSGNPPLCAAGNLTGSLINGDSISGSFPSFDQDPGCGFDWGVEVFIRIRLNANCDSMSGIYATDNGNTIIGFITLSVNGPPPCATVSSGSDISKSAFSVHENPDGTYTIAGNFSRRDIYITDISGRVIIPEWNQEESGNSFSLSENIKGLFIVTNRKNFQVSRFVRR